MNDDLKKELEGWKVITVTEAISLIDRATLAERDRLLDALCDAGFIIGKREGDAFKQYSWDEIATAIEKGEHAN